MTLRLVWHDRGKETQNNEKNVKEKEDQDGRSSG